MPKKEVTLTLGEQIDNLYAIREELREAEAVVKEIKERRTLAEEKIITLLDDTNIDKASGMKATASISETTVGQISDFAKFTRYIKQNNAFELLERRVSSVAYREHLAQRKGKPIPGTEPFTRRTLNLRVRDSKNS